MIRPKPLIATQLIAASATTYYTAPANTKAIFKRAVVCNTDTDAINVTIYVIPYGSAAAAGNTIWSAKTLAPGESKEVSELENMVLDPGDFVQALASEAAKVSFNAGGVLVTQ